MLIPSLFNVGSHLATQDENHRVALQYSWRRTRRLNGVAPQSTKGNPSQIAACGLNIQKIKAFLGLPHGDGTRVPLFKVFG